MGCNLAIAGVTGAVGQEFLKILEQRDFPFDPVKMLASSRSAGKKIEFKGKEYTVEELTKKSFTRIDIALFSAGASRSREFASAAVEAGAVVVDNSSAFRMVPEVPLVIPEINPEKRAGFLTDSEVKRIEQIINDPTKSGLPNWLLNRRKDSETGKDLHIIRADLELRTKTDIKQMKELKSWRGYRHAYGLKVRGQRTRNTGRKGKAVGVRVKKRRM